MGFFNDMQNESEQSFFDDEMETSESVEFSDDVYKEDFDSDSDNDDELVFDDDLFSPEEFNNYETVDDSNQKSNDDIDDEFDDFEDDPEPKKPINKKPIVEQSEIPLTPRKKNAKTKEVIEKTFLRQPKQVSNSKSTNTESKISLAQLNKSASSEPSIISEDMIIEGNITTAGSLNLLGNVKGNIICGGKLSISGSLEGDIHANELYIKGATVYGNVDVKDTVKLDTGAILYGNIQANSAAIAGAIQGTLDIKGTVVLDNSAIILGDIMSGMIQMNPGAAIDGKCTQCYAETSPKEFFNKQKKK